MHDTLELNQPTPATRRSILPTVALLACLLASRLPFLGHPTPVHPDEVSFLAAVGFPTDYPVHAPGYPLWITAGTLLSAVASTPYTAFALASLLASIIGPALLFHWLQPGLDRRLAWTTSLAFGLCPLAWFHSVTALTYWAATAVGIAIVIACDRAIADRTTKPLLCAATLLGVGVFLRTDCLIYFGPLFAWALLRSRSLRAGAACLIPVLALAGFYLLMQFLYGRAGPTTFDDRFGHSRDVLIGTSLFGAGLVDGLFRNVVKILGNLAWNVGPLTAICLATFAVKRRRSVDVHSTFDGPNAATSRSPGRRVVTVWLATGLIFLALFHVVEGYFLWLLPAFYVAGATFLRGRVGPNRAAKWMAAVAVLSALQFLLYPWSSSSVGMIRTLNAKISYLSAAGLMHIHERATIHNDGDVWHIDAHDQEN